MKQRLDMFNRYARWSVEHQTCKAFEWLLLGNPPIDVPFARVIKGQAVGGDIRKCNGYNYMDYIKEATVGEDYVLLTRFDNDDMLLPNFIKDVQKYAKTPNHMYEFKGYRLDLRNGNFYKDKLHSRECTSPFTTIVQRPGLGMKTIYFCNHSKMWKHFQLHIVAKRNWVQIIHDTNWVLNKPSPVSIAKRGTKVKLPPYVRKRMEAEL